MTGRPLLPWRRARWWSEEIVRRYNLTERELRQLADYNAERSRGIAHTEEWQTLMAELQGRYNEAIRQLRP